MEKLESVIVNTVFREDEPKKQFISGDIAKKYLVKYSKIIKELSSYYVENKKDKIISQMQENDVVNAYALYYLPINFYKISFLFSKISKDLFKEKKHINLLDYGCGPATGAIAASDYFKNLNVNLSFTLFDKSLPMLNLGKKLLKGYAENDVLITSNINDVRKKKYDVITLLNAINELTNEELNKLFEDINFLLDSNGILIILEPALKDLARRLMMFRDKILEKYKFSILYPCFHLDKCQMINSENDWCHGEILGLNSKLVRQFDEITGFNKHKIKYSSIILYKNENFKNVNDNFCRIVNIPKETNRGLVLNLCGKDCFKEVTVSKNKLKENKRLKKLKFFDEINKDEIGE